MAVANYHDFYNAYPPAIIYGPDGEPAHSWRVLLLPFLERHELYNRYSFDEPWNGPNNIKLSVEMPDMFAFAGTYQRGQSVSTNFVAITGPETVWPLDKRMGYNGVDGPHSATIQFAEYNGPPIHWLAPVDLQFENMSFVVGAPNGIDSQYWAPAVAMVDGSVQRLDLELAPAELKAMCTASGEDGDPLPHHLQEMEDARKRKLKSLLKPDDSEDSPP